MFASIELLVKLTPPKEAKAPKEGSCVKSEQLPTDRVPPILVNAENELIIGGVCP